MILTEFDECKTSTFNPDEVEEKIEGFPKYGVTFFSYKLMNKFVSAFNPIIISELSNANGRTPIYKINYKNVDIAVFLSNVGAPSCTVAYEEILAKGLEKLVIFGTCGVLDKNISDLAIIIPNSAIRDEGTSYHYLKSSDEIRVNEKYVNEFIDILNEHNYSYVIGKTWTTDSPYRETRKKVEERKKMGAICVEMECASMAAVAKFRGKELFTFFYAADNLDSAKWDMRSLGNDAKLDEKEKIIYLALEQIIKMI